MEDDVKKFIGWKGLADLITQFRGSKRKRNQWLFATAFLTGGRITEVLNLKSENFSLKEDRIVVSEMPLEKIYKKKGEYWEELTEKELEKKVAPSMRRLYSYDDNREVYRRKRFETEKDENAVRREFSFPRNEPFSELVIDCFRNKEGLLFPSPKVEGPLSRQQAYNIMREIGKEITNGMGLYNHWFRAQRASCLTSFYNMRQEKMMEWMTWEHEQTARRYGKMGEVKLAGIMKKKQADIPETVREKIRRIKLT